MAHAPQPAGRLVNAASSFESRPSARGAGYPGWNQDPPGPVGRLPHPVVPGVRRRRPPAPEVHLWRVLYERGRIVLVPLEPPPLTGVGIEPEQPRGGLIIDEMEGGTPDPGFRARVAAALRTLVSRPRGRELIRGLVNLPEHRVFLGLSRATFAREGTFEERDGWGRPSDPEGARTPGRGSGIRINFLPHGGNPRHEVYDRNGNRIEHPFFISLGHELIHARNVAAGRCQVHRALRDTDTPWRNYHNEEERQTIETGDLTENDLRREHGLPLRSGHEGPDPTFRLPRLPGMNRRL